MAGDNDSGFKAACIQFNVVRGDVATNLARATHLVESAAADEAVMLVLPEMWTTSFPRELSEDLLQESEAAEERLRQLSEQHDLVTVGSSLERSEAGWHNTARVYDCGVEVGRYRKIHLFTPQGENRTMAAGSTPLVVDTSLGRVGVVICYDLRFPELIRFLFHRSVEYLVVPAQWPEARSNHWRALAEARAMENQCYVLACNRSGQEQSLKLDEQLVFPGDSRIIDPMGVILAEGSGDDEPVVADLEPRRIRTMRRILPIRKDRRPDVYRALWEQVWEEAEAERRAEEDAANGDSDAGS